MIRRFLTRILLVVLIACCGYNWLQVRHLQRQVKELNTLLAVRAQPSDPDWPTPRSLDDLQAQTRRLRDQADALWRRADAAARHHQ